MGCAKHSQEGQDQARSWGLRAPSEFLLQGQIFGKAGLVPLHEATPLTLTQIDHHGLCEPRALSQPPDGTLRKTREPDLI